MRGGAQIRIDGGDFLAFDEKVGLHAAGWVEVNQNSMQHVRYPNVFSLGDVNSTPNSKTAAAVRKQAPVVVDNILHMMRKTAVEGGYDGYASCH